MKLNTEQNVKPLNGFLYQKKPQQICHKNNKDNSFSNNIIPFKQTKLFIKAPKILLIEDNAITQTSIKAILTILEYETEIAANERDAIALFEKEFDLIFLDIGFLDMNGLGVCMAVRSQEQNKHTPIIATTANAKLVRDKCLAIGLDEFFSKPLTLDSFKEILIRWLPTT